MSKDAVSVVGVKDALKTLNDLDKKTRRQITKQFAEIVDPVIADAQAYLPKPYDRQEIPSGMFRFWNPVRAKYKRGEHDGYVRKRRQNVRGNPIYDVVGVREWVSTESIQTGHGKLDPIETRDNVFPWYLNSPKINPFVSGKRTRQVRLGGGGIWTKNQTAFGVRMTTPGATVFDVAKGGSLGRAITKKSGATPSRVMWRAMDQNRHKVEQNVFKFVQRVITQANNALSYQARLKRALGQ